VNAVENVANAANIAKVADAVENMADKAENAVVDAVENMADKAENAAIAAENAAIAAGNAAIAAGNEAMKIAAESFADLSDIISAFSNLEPTVQNKFKDESVHPEIKDDVEIRVSNYLCKEEEDFLKKRKEFIKESFAKYIGVNVKEIDVDDIPVIAFAGSGGGFRAMIANTGKGN
jgi:predicted lipid-binding transport protein (Tim44 family)